ncbi:MAG: hypothetical protein ACOCTI_07010 [Phycisphaeraceae bacterium]
MADINPGDKINVKIVKRPTNQAALKTVQRLLARDPEMAAEIERERKVRKRNTEIRSRGGRPWAVRLVKHHPVQGEVGEQGTMRATVDVLRDLPSVERFVEVTPA